jgi:uncharacterized protein (DUF488 family)
MATTLYTVGHSNRPIEAFIDVLAEVGIARLVDVRAMPRSRRWPQYDGETLARSLAAHRIEYVWRGEALGGFRKPSPDSPHFALRGSYRGFADHMATAQFAAAIALLVGEAARSPLAIMCAEGLPSECHRALIADYLLARGVDVMHLIAPGERAAAQLNPAVRIVDGQLVYDSVPQPRLL